MSIKLVPELRASFVDEHRRSAASTLLYLEANYDLGDTPLDDSIVRVTTASALVAFWHTRAEVLEMPEPLWMRFLPRHVALTLGFLVLGRLRGRRRVVRTFAMENNDWPVLVTGRRRPGPVPALVVGLVVGAYVRLTHDRIAFASPRSRELYEGLPFARPDRHRSFTELPEARSAEGGGPPSPRTAVFVGALEPRKGVVPLLDAWRLVEGRVPGCRLTVVGPGPEADRVEAWAADRPSSRRHAGHLERRDVLDEIARSTVLVAPSLPDGRWREQIGLPVKEALSLGLTVVTTDQTGLAPWLGRRGHHVLPLTDDADDVVDRLADAITAALEAPLDRATVQASLPPVDARLAADAWLHEPPAGAAGPDGPAGPPGTLSRAARTRAVAPRRASRRLRPHSR